MDKRAELQSTLRIEDVPTVRSRVAQKLREAIMSGTLKPGQRLVERELCEMTGVSRPSIREALRLLEADGLVTTVPHRGPVVSTISLDEAKQLYAARAVLEGFAGRECARLRDPAVVLPVPKYVPLNPHVPGTIALAFFTHRGFLSAVTSPWPLSPRATPRSVSPSASTAAIRMSSVPVTVILSNA